LRKALDVDVILWCYWRLGLSDKEFMELL